MKKLLIFVGLLLTLTVSAAAQVAQGGVYKLDQAIVSSGGGTSADATGNTYKLLGVTGEPVAGTTSNGATYAVKGGFLNNPSVAPTAAAVSIGGRVLNFEGGGLMNARVTLTDLGGGSLTITTGKLGAFRFTNVESGKTYIISIGSRHYTFQPQVVSVSEDLTDLNFTAQQATVLN